MECRLRLNANRLIFIVFVSLCAFSSFPFCLFIIPFLFIPFPLSNYNIFLIPFVNSLSHCQILISFIFVHHSLYLYHHSLCLITAFLFPFVNSLSLCKILIVFLMYISYSIRSLPFSLAFPFCLCPLHFSFIIT